MAPAILPASPETCPVARKVPESVVDTTSAFGRPLTASGLRAIVQSISALDSNCGSGFSRLPTSWRGAAVSSALWIAESAIAAGVTITDLRATGASGGTSTSAGRCSFGFGPGEIQFNAQTATPNETMATSTPMTILPQGKCTVVPSSELRPNLIARRSWCQQGGGLHGAVVSAAMRDD